MITGDSYITKFFPYLRFGVIIQYNFLSSSLLYLFSTSLPFTLSLPLVVKCSILCYLSIYSLLEIFPLICLLKFRNCWTTFVYMTKIYIWIATRERGACMTCLIVKIAHKVRLKRNTKFWRCFPFNGKIY